MLSVGHSQMRPDPDLRFSDVEVISDLDLSCFREVQKLSLIRVGSRANGREIWRQRG